jgi:hypothetical protein
MPVMRVLLLMLTLCQQGDYDSLMARLKLDSPGEYAKVATLDRRDALEFLLRRYGGGKSPEKAAPDKAPAQPALPERLETFTAIETIDVGGVSIDLCTRADGAFGLGAVRRDSLDWRRADFLVTWTVDGRHPRYASRNGLTVTLKQPDATLTFAAGTLGPFRGFRLELAANGTVVETASWEPGGSTRGLTYFDGYRGWHGPPAWTPANVVAATNPKLAPSMLHGTGFQMVHGAHGALVLFHATAGDRLQNASRGEALEFETSFPSGSIARHVLFAAGPRSDLWSRAFDVAHAEQRRALGLPAPTRELWCEWGEFTRGFEAMKGRAKAAAEYGFTGVLINVVWDNIELHGGKKNMNIWDLSVAEGYGSESALKQLVDECHREKLLVAAWMPSGHLTNTAPLWQQHPDWVLKSASGVPALNPSGLTQGDLDSGYHDYFRDRIAGVIRRMQLDGLWLDSHLAYAQQQRPNHGAKLAAIYREFVLAGAKHLIAEGDASVLGSYGIAIDESWGKEWGGMPSPELYYGSSLVGSFDDPQQWTRHFRAFAAHGALWIVPWDALTSPKRTGALWDEARAEIRAVLVDYARVKDRMVHRSIRAEGVTWTNDRDATKVVWLLHDATLPDGKPGKAGQVYELE